MKTYGMKPKYEEDILTDINFYFNAENQKDADSKAWNWNRSHGFADCPGYGFCIALEVNPADVPNEGWIHNEWVW